MMPQGTVNESDVDMKRFFAPRGVVAFGSVSSSPALLARFDWYDCPLAFVNPKGGDAGKYPVYRQLSEVPGTIDLAIIRTAPPTVLKLIEECGERGIAYALVFSSGFSEVGGEGVHYERQLTEVAARAGVRVMGPNTNDNAFEPRPVPDRYSGGLIGLVTQSGHNGRPIVQGEAIGAAFSRWIAGGNEADLDASHFIRYFAEDERTRTIAGYIEGFRSIPRLREALHAANAADKPVTILKIGSTERGAAVAVSHTGHLAGSDGFIGGLFRQHGVTRVSDLDELLETSNLFSKLPAGIGPRAALYSISGGSGTLMAEVADSFGIPTPELGLATQAALHEMIPTYLTVANPIDNGGGFTLGAPKADRMRVLDLIAEDPAIDYIVVGLTGALGPGTDAFAEDVLEWSAKGKKPIMFTWNSFKVDEPGYATVVRSGLPVFRSFRNCFRALRAYSDYEQARETFRRRPSLARRLESLDEACRVPGPMASAQVTALLDELGIRRPREAIVQSAAQAGSLVAELGGRVALKLVSAAFPHKSDVGLVQLDVTDAQSAATQFDRLLARARELDGQAPIDGVLVQEQVEGGVEMIVGLTHDKACGPALTIGAGGIYAEILRDIAVRPLPVDEADVREMLASLKVSALLEGVRGKPRADVEALIRTALAVAALGESAGERIAELDLNPVIVTPQGAVAADALVVVARS
jgi:acyl-CoA synthetase (NDP forming)